MVKNVFEICLKKSSVFKGEFVKSLSLRPLLTCYILVCLCLLLFSF